MYKPNIVNGVLTSRFDEIKTHLNHQLSFSPNSNQGHVLVDNQFYDFEVNEDGDLFSPEKLDGYDYYNGKSYLGHYNQLQFTPEKRGGAKAPSGPGLYALPANRVNNMKGAKSKPVVMPVARAAPEKSGSKAKLLKYLRENPPSGSGPVVMPAARAAIPAARAARPAARAARPAARGSDATAAGMESDLKQDDYMTRANNSKTDQIKRYMQLSKKKKGNNNEIAKQDSPRILLDKDMVPNPGPDDEQPMPSNYNEYSPYKFSPSESVIAAEAVAKGAAEAADAAANAEGGSEESVTKEEVTACAREYPDEFKELS